MSIKDSKVTFNVDTLSVHIFPNRQAMGEAAAHHISDKMQKLIREYGSIRMIFASAPSQNEVLATLSTLPGIDWSKVTAFHMDEYIGIPGDSPQSFGYYIREHLWDKVSPKHVHFINSLAENPQKECRRYAALISESPIDIVCMGIGENGHIAFNDPPVANFNDPEVVKIVELDEACRRQQVNDGCFSSLSVVPKTAITLTVPTLFSGKHLICVVPGPTKTKAVFNTLTNRIDATCPATILRTHPQAVLYLDKTAAAKLDDGGLS
ncbi:glucosamine-6-phosphate deaminase [candidate division KSB1 bacterium]|nr:glucosamine-6-phosphate deaminase [candidate division KSB1 bacterium]